MILHQKIPCRSFRTRFSGSWPTNTGRGTAIFALHNTGTGWYPGQQEGIRLFLLSSTKASRNPRLLLRLPGSFLLRLAERTLAGLLFQLPPRITRWELFQDITLFPSYHILRECESAGTRNLVDTIVFCRSPHLWAIVGSEQFAGLLSPRGLGSYGAKSVNWEMKDAYTAMASLAAVSFRHSRSLAKRVKSSGDNSSR